MLPLQTWVTGPCILAEKSGEFPFFFHLAAVGIEDAQPEVASLAFEGAEQNAIRADAIIAVADAMNPGFVQLNR
jgi:hypothetical protein